mmetsp:Transcript_21790/g.29206  ORF Transcript_21790/g.29206 Transcript_21790/m.29206 type:complete len:115 (+) Transcript_21790:865-1209(+)|eukprot:CAMPEP_0185597880 /NCGR_PEP_ID=MMETSP0434-20130131/81642_1 /TAXON_ID=626734 ORGANISM="Favella taraikaensis, Strain Fe Narragansett Bay" /NCGR_SAMPLE_ID=MMETSP0434 /ASSEMBLY_ACC=CAM_ASM_000379 /LENGTH=114 /DNA_ID=CAMNT_0028226713 /DNA_START=1528 /DNA_END=1872 /DNA_ORIENTATION=-
MVKGSRDGGIPTPADIGGGGDGMLVHHELKIQESQLEFATDYGEQDLAPSGGNWTAQHDQINQANFKWTKVDLARQKDEKMAAMKREIAAVSQLNGELLQVLQSHAMKCPELQS